MAAIMAPAMADLAKATRAGRSMSKVFIQTTGAKWMRIIIIIGILGEGVPVIQVAITMIMQGVVMAAMAKTADMAKTAATAGTRAAQRISRTAAQAGTAVILAGREPEAIMAEGGAAAEDKGFFNIVVHNIIVFFPIFR